ncbi:hypothetical protein DSO57_1030828 [Entomophthora muscae]|uniref:Uncharacterized protein n=1 Tax=Entomophthora muscae TaxID=34485 RepID=A0ACC2TBX9_9FUNG|nr:hypothetical protein DSO57_1030828 [Entomophthora muscae]
MQEWWLIYAVSWNSILLTFTAIFLSLYKHLTVRFRGIQSTIASLAATFLISNLLLITRIFPSEIPCWIVLWSLNLTLPIWLFGIFGKFFVFAFKYHQAHSRNQGSSGKASFLVFLSLKYTVAFKLTCLFTLFFIHGTIAGSMHIFIPHQAPLQNNCISGLGLIPVELALIYLSFGSPILIFTLWPAKDAYLLKLELYLLFLTATPILLLITLSTFLESIFTQVQPTILVLVFLFISALITLGVPSYDVLRSSLKKTPTNFALFQLMLNDPIQFLDFKDFTISDFTIENPLFYEEYSRFLSNHHRLANKPTLRNTHSFFPRFLKGYLSNLDHLKKPRAADDMEANLCLTKPVNNSPGCSRSALNDLTPRFSISSEEGRELKRLYDKFIVPGAEFQLNLLGSTVRKISVRFEDNNLELHMLDQVMEEVLDSMYRNSFVRFLKYQQR